MEIINNLIDCLEKSPMILNEFIKGMPTDQLKVQQRPDKWSIHENACHLAQAEVMICERFERMKNEANPVFNPYIPGDTVSDSDLIHLNLNEQLNQFAEVRFKTVTLLRSYDSTIWDKPAVHPQYYDYNARILLRHTLMHDHFHMYRMEELWLTKPEFL